MAFFETHHKYNMLPHFLKSHNKVYTQVVDNKRIIKGFFWSIMDHYLKDGSLDDDNIQ